MGISGHWNQMVGDFYDKKVLHMYNVGCGARMNYDWMINNDVAIFLQFCSLI